MAQPRGHDSYYSGSSNVQKASSAYSQQVMREKLTPDAHGVILVMVGLPARGKSFISRKVEGFLQWRGIRTRSFNVGRYRRSAVDPQESGRNDFFDMGNKNALATRERAAFAALTDTLAFLDGGGKVAILDATNTTVARRQALADGVSLHNASYTIIFVESICDDPQLLEANLLDKALNSPDFEHMSPEDALADLKKRIALYEDVYETVNEDESACIKLFNLSSKVMANHCYGRIAKSVLPYLMAIHVGARPIWLVRAGAGQSNPQSPGSECLSELSPSGHNSALQLAAFIQERAGRYWAAAGHESGDTYVLTSTMLRAVDSVCFGTSCHEQTSALNPIDKGAVGVGWWDVECHADMPPWEEVERRHPEFFAKWQRDPLRCRFPGGESYMDVVNRLEGLLIDVEMCTRPVLIVSHITTLQLLVAYFRGVPVENAWQIPFCKNTVMEITPAKGGSFKCEEHALCMGSSAVADVSPPPKRTAEASPAEVAKRQCVSRN